MALEPTTITTTTTTNGGFVAADALTDLATDTALPLFNVEQVQLQFPIYDDFVAGQVANNVIILALSSGRILRIDLNRPDEIQGISFSLSPPPTL